jgi:hypothetical protein
MNMGNPGQNQKLLKFIDLDRRFRKLNPQENPEEAALESYTASLMGLEAGLGWEGLLEQPLVVVLGEPGSGKTWEFRERTRILQTRGKNAFLIPLDRLISEPLTDILSPEENNIFQAWLRNSEEATFFLDSVDEAKHQRTSDFFVALDQHGDPSQLTLEYRRSLLKALVERYEGRKHVWINAEHESLSRLADPGLTDDLVGIIRNRKISADVRSEMLRLVQHGRLTGCLDAALDLVADKSESDDLKIYAVIALRDAGETPHLLRLWKIIKQFSHISTRICARCCEALYPRAIDVEGLADLLRKSATVPRNSVDLPFYLRQHLEEVLTTEASGPALIQLAALLE